MVNFYFILFFHFQAHFCMFSKIFFLRNFVFSPHRIFADAGSAFAMGLVGGSIFHSFSAYKNAAKNQKLASIIREVRVRSPVTGGQFAAWGGLFSTIDCTLVAVRKKVGIYLVFVVLCLDLSIFAGFIKRL